MSVVVAHGAVCVGMGGQLVEVQVDVASGLPGMTIVGLPDTSISESRDRVRAALSNSGFEWPSGRITVGLSPAFEHKRGSGLDLAVAVAVLMNIGIVPAERWHQAVFLGELGLDGSIRATPGVIATALGVRRQIRQVFASPEAARQAARVPGLRAVPVQDLGTLVGILRGRLKMPDAPQIDDRIPDGIFPELADVLGQPVACHALEVCAAGGHHLLLNGPPGVGKTMLAQRLPGLLPPLSDQQVLEVTAVADAVDPSTSRMSRVPPFRAPHHSASHVAMVGGALNGFTRPGQISLSHHGVLFLDEAPEFQRMTLESLRQPLEDGVVTIARAAITEQLPARFQLVLAANPCPCGEFGTDLCRCSVGSVRKYRERLSGPLLDRIDLRLEVRSPRGLTAGEPSAVVRQRVLAARDRAGHRLATIGEMVNARVPAGPLRRDFRLDTAATALLNDWYAARSVSLRSMDRIARVSWTLADLEGVNRPGLDHVQRALTLRNHSGKEAA